MGRRPETRGIYKRNETEVDGWKREKEEMGGKRYPSSQNAYLLTATCICMGWSNDPIKTRGELDQMEKKGGE